LVKEAPRSLNFPPIPPSSFETYNSESFKINKKCFKDEHNNLYLNIFVIQAVSLYIPGGFKLAIQLLQPPHYCDYICEPLYWYNLNFENESLETNMKAIR
jgi:hypothetical protein